MSEEKEDLRVDLDYDDPFEDLADEAYRVHREKVRKLRRESIGETDQVLHKKVQDRRRITALRDEAERARVEKAEEDRDHRGRREHSPTDGVGRSR